MGFHRDYCRFDMHDTMRHDVTHYHIIEKLGQGGMGVVYKAEDLRLGRVVALKFLPEELTRDDESKQRFIQEAQAASALNHANICTIYEVDETADGVMFISMAYYEGETLKDRIANGRLSLETAIDIAIQVAHGLVNAHTHNIVHRDIKPANIIVDDDGNVKILDFGLAKLAGQLRLTKTDTTMGTAAYMSPEQVMGKDVGPQTDIWSLGAILYEMLAGEIPFRGDFEQAIIYAVLNEEPASLAEVRPDIPAELPDIITKALAKDQAHRYQQAKELLDDLTNLKRNLDRDPGTARRPGHFERHWRLYVAVATLVVLVTLSAVAQHYMRIHSGKDNFEFGQSRQVTTGDVWQDEPALSPDGGRIAYTSDANGNRDLYIIDVRGGIRTGSRRIRRRTPIRPGFPMGRSWHSCRINRPARGSGESGSSAAGPHFWSRMQSTRPSPPTPRGSPSRRQVRAGNTASVSRRS